MAKRGKRGVSKKNIEKALKRRGMALQRTPGDQWTVLGKDGSIPFGSIREIADYLLKTEEKVRVSGMIQDAIEDEGWRDLEDAMRETEADWEDIDCENEADWEALE